MTPEEVREAHEAHRAAQERMIELAERDRTEAEEREYRGRALADFDATLERAQP